MLFIGKLLSMKHYIYGLHAVMAALKQRPQTLERLFLATNRQDQKIQELRMLAEKNQIEISLVDKKKLDELTAEANHQGTLAYLMPAPALEEADLEDYLAQLPSPRSVLLLDSVQDPHNLGACLRTAETAGIQLVIAPKDKACDITPIVRKAACGAAELVAFMQVTNLARTIEKLQKSGFWVYGLAGEATQSLYQTRFDGDCAFVMGAEGSGIRRLIKEKCDFLLKIPMLGQIESLNVSVACGIVLYEFVRQRLG